MNNVVTIGMREWYHNTNKHMHVGTLIITKRGKSVFKVTIESLSSVDKPNVVTKKKEDKDPSLCKFKGCSFNAYQDGYCMQHIKTIGH